MNISATHKNARMAPQKVRPLSRILRGLSVTTADHQLQFAPGKAAVVLRQVLKSAVANATHNYDMQAKDLVVREILINQGFVLKRVMPVSRGMAHPILKRTAHITIVIGEAKASAKPKKLKGRKSEISTITAEEFVERDMKEAQEALAEKATETKEGKAGMEDTGRPATPDKSMESFQKTKMIQQGGDAKKNSRRQTKKSGHK